MEHFDDLLLSFLRNRDRETVISHLHQCREITGSFDLDRIALDLALLESTAPPDLPRIFPALTRALPGELKQLYWFRYVITRVACHPLEPEEYNCLAECSSSAIEAERILVDICRIVGLWISGLEPRPVPKLEAIRQRILPLEATVAKAFISAMAEHSLGYGYKGMGNFRDAARCFARASELAGFYEFYTLPIYRSALGKLMWESGQYRKALELHCDGDTRRLARDLGDEHFLIDSHLCAAKAALDLGALEKAKEELKAAEIHLADDESRYPILHAYHDVFEAQLSAKLGHGDLARATLQRAIEQFQQMAPPCYLGTLDCKIELIRLDLVEGDLGAVLRQLEPLIEEAESREVMGARTRLLAFQARLYLDPNVPAPLLRDGYNDLIQRLELINNPRLTFLAYSDLYTYARRHLESEEQKRWLLRLRNLEPLLERSCYEELYRDYVTERYRSELERELDEHGKDGTFK